MFNKICKKCGNCYVSKSRNTMFCDNCKTVYEPKVRKSKFSCNFFKDDIEGYSYFMGFVCGDGYVHPYKDEVSWYSTDKQIVDDLTQRLNYDRIPHLNKKKTERTKACYGNILYVENAKYFVNNGLLNDKKDLDYSLMRNVEIRHFLRGLFDSDGTLVLRDGKTGNKILNSISFLGQSRLLKSLQFVLKNEIVEKRGVCEIKIGGRLAYDILHFMYDDSTIRLERKYQKFKIVENHKFRNIVL